jgi:putative transposase
VKISSVRILYSNFSIGCVSLHSQVPLDKEVKLYHGRELGDRYRYLFFDGVVLKSKGAAKVQKKILLCAFGITLDGGQEMIDFYPAASESQACWEAFLNDLYQRGLKGSPCELMATDGGTGLHQALQIVYPKISLQRCWAHKTRNVLDKVKEADQVAVKKAFPSIQTQSGGQLGTPR